MYRQRKRFYSKEIERWQNFVKKYNLEQYLRLSDIYRLVSSDNDQYLLGGGHKSIFNKTLYKYVFYGSVDKKKFDNIVEKGMILAEVFDNYDLQYDELRFPVGYAVREYVYNRIHCNMLKEKTPIARKFKWRV